ncbi:YgiW/YdeI family stress tolerance OB fold protein [Erwinia tasmaniensis]|uniref:YgiW/YdeI family stress tolerance OB fold protein n=1 Tax=Erwinia tasmaniensis TaxID=338565 RepID=UPI003A4DCBF7
MKKILTLAALLAFSLNVMADDGGFKGGDAPPPPQKKDAGYKGTEDTTESQISGIRDLRDGAWVTLEGNLIKQTGRDTFLFRDKSGTIDVTVPHAAWKGKKYGADDQVRISGYVKGRGKHTHVEAKQLSEP